MKLRETFSTTNEISRVYDYGVSHARLSAKNDFIIELCNAKDPLRLNGYRRTREISTKIFKIIAIISWPGRTLSKDGVVAYAYPLYAQDVNTILSTIDE